MESAISHYEMARRILFVEQTSPFREADKELVIDWPVEVDWKFRMAVDDWTGDVQTAPPTYKVRPIKPFPSEFNEYGVISDPDDVAWLAKAMTRKPDDYTYQAIPLLARVNELAIENGEGRKGFKIEVLTAKDATSFAAARKRDERMVLFKNNWLWVGLGLLAAWWWLG